MQRKILGLDPGFAILGFGAIICEKNQANLHGDSVKLLDFGVITTPAKTPLEQRLCTLYDDLHTVIKQFQPDLVAIEKFRGFFFFVSLTDFTKLTTSSTMLSS